MLEILEIVFGMIFLFVCHVFVYQNQYQNNGNENQVITRRFLLQMRAYYRQYTDESEM